jgi:hypothetical protein
MRIMTNFRNLMQCTAAAVGLTRASALVILAGALVTTGSAMAAGISGAQYREAVNQAQADYRAKLLECKAMSAEQRTACRKEAAAARKQSLSDAKAARAAGTSPDSKPLTPASPSGLKASKTDIDPKLQRDSPPDIVPPKSK